MSAISLVTWDEASRKFCLDPEGLAFIKKQNSPLAVVSVAGMYRTGKSYLLNRVLLNRSNAFEVGPSINPCTKGIWVWGEAIAGKLEDGTACTVIVIDTEGMGGLDKDCDYDARIFSIATLISSCFIYNSMGSIDENAIENLGLIVNLTKMIQASDPTSFFPKFMWVLRDFCLKLIDSEGFDITANEYLEKALELRKGFSDSIENKNRIRNTLKEFFKERECVTLVRPIVESRLGNLDETDMSELRKDFVEQVEELREKVMREAKPKKMSGRDLNGEMLVKLLESYVDAFNSGNVPNIDTAWNYICKAQNRKALEKAIEVYTEGLNEAILPVEDEELIQVHKDAKTAAIKYLSKNTTGDLSGIFEDFKESSKEKLDEKKLENQYQQKMHFMTFLKDQYTELDSMIKAGGFNNMQTFEKTLKALEKNYYENCLNGRQKAEIFLTFAREISNKAADYLVSFYRNEVKVQKGINEDQVAKFTADLKEAKESYMILKKDSDKQVSKLENELNHSLTKESVVKDQLSHITKQKEDLEVSLKELTKQKSAEIEELKRKLLILEESFKDQSRKNNDQLSECEDSKALLQQKLTFTEHTLEELKAKDKSYTDKLKDLRLEHAQAQKSLQTKFEQQLEKITEKLEEKVKENNEYENEIELKEALLEEVQTLLNETKNEFAGYKDKAEAEIEMIRKEAVEKENFYIKKIEKAEQEYKTATARIRARLSETEKKLRNSEELLRNDMAIWAQDNAILVQKIEFLEQEIEEQKTKREEEKRHYKSVISTLEHVANKDEN